MVLEIVLAYEHSTNVSYYCLSHLFTLIPKPFGSFHDNQITSFTNSPKYFYNLGA